MKKYIWQNQATWSARLKRGTRKGFGLKFSVWDLCLETDMKTSCVPMQSRPSGFSRIVVCRTWRGQTRRWRTSMTPCRLPSLLWRRSCGRRRKTTKSWFHAGWLRRRRRPTSWTLRTRRTAGKSTEPQLRLDLISTLNFWPSVLALPTKCKGPSCHLEMQR